MLPLQTMTEIRGSHRVNRALSVGTPTEIREDQS